MRADGYTERVEYILSPDTMEPPRPGARLRATGTWLVPWAGRHVLSFASTAKAALFVDEKLVLGIVPGARPEETPIVLSAGAHSITIQMSVADSEGGLVLGVRGPLEPFRMRPLGGREIVSAHVEQVRSQLGAFPQLLLVLRAWSGPICAVLFVLLVLGVCRVSGRFEWVPALYHDPVVLRFASGCALLAIISPVIYPLLSPGYYACHEEESFIVRFEQFAKAMSDGVPLGRWWPDPVLGRGYPFLSFYMPLLYLLAWPALRMGAAPVPVLRIESALIVLCGAVVVYRLARRYCGREGSLVAAALWSYAPYLHTDLYVRGSIAEVLAFSCFPLALWALDRALDSDAGIRSVSLLALALGAVGLSHNISAYFSLLFLALWALVRVLWFDGAAQRKQLLWRLSLAGTLGFLLCAFSTVPAVAEMRLVRTELLTTGYYSYFKHFTPFARLIYEPLSHNPYEMRRSLGLFSAAAILFAGLALLLREKLADIPRARQLAVLSLCGVFLAMGMITKTLGPGLFRYLPLAKYVGFAWRIFLFAATFAALCGAAAWELWFSRRKWCAAVPLAMIVLWGASRTGSPQILLRKHIHSTEFLRNYSVDYVTAQNEYLPKAVKKQAPPFDLVARVASGTASILDGDRKSGYYRISVRAETTTEIEWNAHAFPGWSGRIDGKRVDVGARSASPPTENGLLRLVVSPGQHVVEIVYGRTALRWICDLLSLGAMGICAVLLLSSLRKRKDGV